MWWVRHRGWCGRWQRETRGERAVVGLGFETLSRSRETGPLSQADEKLHHWAPDNVADERITAKGTPVALANGRSDEFPSGGRRGASGLGQEGVKRKMPSGIWKSEVNGWDAEGVCVRAGVDVGDKQTRGGRGRFRYGSTCSVPGRKSTWGWWPCTLSLEAGPPTACPVFDRCG